ncbi:hypothetical protein AKI39_12125 [Bordetella sp. H567]|uniref:DUF2894 domain-containing protein n=1 Tax=Bordetella sp. H567 TaxID=1697043 RepID=UPI00081CFCE9|nr:DUF2894 domain-containing protein [Bordetella sp. H567]AOB31280.1 hypothetical protein AKI39_12125 [Bordetella sp. H567]
MSDDAKNPDSACDPLALLAAWRAQGADRLNPIRFHLIDALSRRAAAQRGHTRRLLDDRLATLVQAYKGEVAAADSRAMIQPQDPAPAGPASAPAQAGPLAELVARLADRRPATPQDADDAAIPPAPSTYPELPLLDYFRDTWSRYSTRHQLRQSEERVPENAGPLNSSLLVHRALSLMREVSPEYLHQFLSYVDALSWMEQATRVDLLMDKEGTRSGPSRKTARRSR